MWESLKFLKLAMTVLQIASLILSINCCADEANIFKANKKTTRILTKKNISHQNDNGSMAWQNKLIKSHSYFHGIFTNQQGEQYIWIDGKLLLSQTPNYPLMCDSTQTHCVALAIKTNHRQFSESNLAQQNNVDIEQ